MKMKLLKLKRKNSDMKILACNDIQDFEDLDSHQKIRPSRQPVSSEEINRKKKKNKVANRKKLRDNKRNFE